MKPVMILECEKYLQQTLGIKISLIKWSGEHSLPIYLQEQYEYCSGALLDLPCLFAFSTGKKTETPLTVKKHLNILSELSGLSVVYIHSSITSWNRARLVEQKIPFIIPGRQMYLPPLGIDFKEFSRKRTTSPRPSLSPAAQRTMLHIFYNKPTDPLKAVDLARITGYSRMTISRIFNELEAAEENLIIRSGKFTLLQPPSDYRDLWESLSPKMNSPVLKQLRIIPEEIEPELFIAGESALASCTILAEPEEQFMAVSKGRWQKLQKTIDIREIETRTADSIILEIWQYPPEKNIENRMVDPLSLYLSLRSNEDERIASALEELLEQYVW